MKTNKSNFRIMQQGGTIKFAGTDHPSWLTLEQAKKLVDYSKDEIICEYCEKSGRKLWAIL